MITSARVPLIGDNGQVRGELMLSCLKGDRFASWRGVPALLDFSAEADFVGPAAPVQLLEEMSYGYRVMVPNVEVVSLEPSDHFTSTSSFEEGRLEAKRSTGTLNVSVRLANGDRLRGSVEVRSRKLDYEREYRNMLMRIARESAELLQSAFAPSSLPAFRPDVLHDPKTIYQRFAFIQALLDSEQVQDALHLIHRRPHLEHRTITEPAAPGRPLRSSASLARQLVASGPRHAVARPIAGLTTLPDHLVHTTNDTTFDTVPNRFVRYVLTRWRDIANDVERALNSNSPSDQRGRLEAHLVAEELEQLLTIPALAEAGRLNSFPASNQVLQGRSGYRDVFEAFLLAEAASTIDWDDGQQLFGAGQRNVAELYEYWVFLELVRIVETLPGFTVDRRSLIKRSANGVSLDLHRESQPAVEATGHHRGTQITIKVWFNKSFQRNGPDDASTWTIPLRPDCSIQILPAQRPIAADTWIHFDAKYRIGELDSSFTDSFGDESQNLGGQVPLPADLAKMHTYRDAIRRTAGSYVLYPGNESAAAVRHEQYREILPGLGAFTLRPATNGEAPAAATAALRNFILDVVDHVAAQGTAAERARYWSTRSYTEPSTRTDVNPLLVRPAADTTVLLGFVKSSAHRDWVLQHSVYNLRADRTRSGSVSIDGPELAASIVVLYDELGSEVDVMHTAGAVTVRTAEQLATSGYPSPGGDMYLCLGLDVSSLKRQPLAAHVRELARNDRTPTDWAAPLMVTWAQLT